MVTEDDDETVRINSDDDDDEIWVQPTEDEYETRNEEDLPELPSENIANYEQENTDYFKTKRYVRNDKFSLKKIMMIDDDGSTIELPSLFVAFPQRED